MALVDSGNISFAGILHGILFTVANVSRHIWNVAFSIQFSHLTFFPENSAKFVQVPKEKGVLYAACVQLILTLDMKWAGCSCFVGMSKARMYHFVKCGGCLNSSLLESSICLLHSFLWWERWKHEERRWEENWGCKNWNNEEGKTRICREDWEILPPRKSHIIIYWATLDPFFVNKLISSSTNILKGQKINSSSCCEKKIKKLVQMLHISVETYDKRCRKSFSWYYWTVYVASVQPTPELCRCRML